MQSVCLEIYGLSAVQRKLEFASNQRDKFRIRGFSLGIADGIAEKSLQCIQVASVPGDFNGMSDCPLHTAGCGLECFRHLGVQNFRDGIGVPYGPPGGLVGCSWRTLRIQRLNVADLLLSLSSRLLLLYGFENMIAKPNSKVKREPNEHFRKFLVAFSALFRTN